MEAVWPDERLDVSRLRTKRAVATGYTRFQDGDVLLPKITPTFEAGRSVLISGLRNGVGAGTTELHVLRPRRQIEPRFLTYVTQSHPFLRLGEAEMYGVAGQKRVPDAFVRDFTVNLPAIEEQRRIADFLDAETRRIDEVRLARRRMQELLRLKRERVIEDLIDDQGYGGTLVPLKHLVDAVKVGIVITPAAWYVDSGGVPALRGVNVKPGRIDDNDLVHISHEGHVFHRKSELRVGDLVVVRTGQAGAAAAVTDDFDGANCIDLVIVRTGVALVPRFAEYLLNSSYAKRRVAEFAVGSIQSHFNVAAMKAMPIPRRSPADQRRIVDEIDRAVEPIDKAINQMHGQDQLLAERRQALITAAVTGQLDPMSARSTDLR
jgi:type I restriction enzyme, S subunit